MDLVRLVIGETMKQHHSREDREHNVWQIQEAKAQFSRLVEEANLNGFQIITKQGEPIAVILSKKEFDNITQPKTSLLSFFKASPCQEVGIEIHRSKDFPREVDL